MNEEASRCPVCDDDCARGAKRCVKCGTRLEEWWEFERLALEAGPLRNARVLAAAVDNGRESGDLTGAAGSNRPSSRPTRNGIVAGTLVASAIVGFILGGWFAGHRAAAGRMAPDHATAVRGDVPVGGATALAPGSPATSDPVAKSGGRSASSSGSGSASAGRDATGRATTAATPHVSQAELKSDIQYVVQPGDSLWRIAAALTGRGANWQMLWPHATSEDRIIVGQVLIVDQPRLQEAKAMTRRHR